MSTEFYKLLNDLSPETILLVGSVSISKDIYKAAHWSQTDFLLEDLSEYFDLAIVGADFVLLDKSQAEIMLAGLRDRLAGTLWVLHRPSDKCWQLVDFISLGMQQLLSFDSDSVTYHLYGFSLQSYKTVPDWLNSDYWANPDRFVVRD